MQLPGVQVLHNVEHQHAVEGARRISAGVAWASPIWPERYWRRSDHAAPAIAARA